MKETAQEAATRKFREGLPGRKLRAKQYIIPNDDYHIEVFKKLALAARKGELEKALKADFLKGVNCE